MFRYMFCSGVSCFCSFVVSIFICSPPNDVRYMYLFSVIVFRIIFPSRDILLFLVSRGWLLIWMVTLFFSCRGNSSLGSSIVIFICSSSDVSWYSCILFDSSMGFILVSVNSVLMSAICYITSFPVFLVIWVWEFDAVFGFLYCVIVLCRYEYYAEYAEYSAQYYGCGPVVKVVFPGFGVVFD